MVTRDSILVTVLKRDRLVVAASLAAKTALAWVYLVRLELGMGTGGIGEAASGLLSGLLPWTAADFALMALMWSVMMTGMMIPAAAPMILLFATISRNKHEQQRAYAPTAVFVLGYVLVWSAFAVAATVLQGLLQ